MPETGTSGSMSGDGKRSDGQRPPSYRAHPRLYHLYGPAARCKPKMMIWRKLVLRFCIRPIDGV